MRKIKNNSQRIRYRKANNCTRRDYLVYIKENKKVLENWAQKKEP